MKIGVAAFFVVLVVCSGAAMGQRRMGQGGGDGDSSAIAPSGLKPAYPREAQCPEIASPYGSRTRQDGSQRPAWSFGGLHGGMDISLPEGVPLLAIAAGSVAGKGEGGVLEGIYLWLRHAPEDTGLPYWVYSKYQHLLALPELEAGARVALGQVIARSGKTGTADKHYGPSGYPHLHLTTRKAARGDAAILEGTLFDPLAIYHDAAMNARGSLEGGVPVPYATPDGRIASAGVRVVWPVACQPR